MSQFGGTTPALLLEPSESTSWSFYRTRIVEFMAIFLFFYIISNCNESSVKDRIPEFFRYQVNIVVSEWLQSSFSLLLPPACTSSRWWILVNPQLSDEAHVSRSRRVCPRELHAEENKKKKEETTKLHGKKKERRALPEREGIALALEIKSWSHLVKLMRNNIL